MKLLEKFVLILYSLIMLIISVFVCLVMFEVIDTETISNWIQYILNDSSIVLTVVICAVICILLSIRCLFFRKRKEIKKSDATDILLENDSGRLLISKRAIENEAKNVVEKLVENVKECKTTVDIDPANNLSIYVSIILNNNEKIREKTLELQNKIKSQIKEDFDLDVKQVNIKIDSIEEKNKIKKSENKLLDETNKNEK